MANAWKEIDWIAAESLTIMTDSLVLAPLTAMDKTSDWNSVPDGYRKGDTVRIKTGPDYTVDEFSSTVTIQDIRSSTRTMTIEKHFDITVELTASEMALNFEGFSTEVVAPAARRLAEKVDQYLGTKILNGAGLYHSTTLLESASDMALARKEAKYQQLEPNNRFVVMDDTLEATLLGQTWFNQSQTRGADGEITLRNGSMGTAMGMEFFASSNFPSEESAATGTYGDASFLTNNTSGTTNLVGDTTLVVDNSGGADSLAVGDHLKIAGVRRPLIVASAIADTTSTTSITLRDPITEIIPDNAAVTVQGSGLAFVKRGAIFDNKSMAVAFPMLDMPGDKVASVLSSDGVSIRVVVGYDMTTKKTMMSLDMLCGAECYDPRRITLLSNDS